MAERARRLAATVLCDLRMQFRNGFYYAAAFVVVAMILLLSWLPDRYVETLLPLVLVENIILNTYFFAGGLILLEKNEGTLQAQVVTPLRDTEYLMSKLVTLGGLSLVESVLIWAVACGFDLGILPLAAGIVLASVFFGLFGVAVVARYDSVNEYLLPSSVFTVILSLPMLGQIGIGPAAWYEIHPVEGVLNLMRATYEPLAAWRLAWSIAYPLIVIVPLWFWSRGALRRFVVAAAGVR